MLQLQRKLKQKSPLFIYESEVTKLKNFSEAKRLFYVACTRAKKKLCWVSFNIPDKTFSIPKNSWIIGLNAWMQMKMLNQHLTEIHLDEFDSKELLAGQNLPELPLFFHDFVGVFPKGSIESELFIIPELSVTRLNDLIDCPRKFYLSNILKIRPPGDEHTFSYEDNDEEVAVVVHSSPERGIQIHEQIAAGIQNAFIAPHKIDGTEFQKPVQWALHLLEDKTDDYDLIPERTVKFKFFNFMITGTPDLLLIPKGDCIAQVWDYKTGRMSPESLKHYWPQLFIYAYALYELGHVSKTKEIELILCFVDHQNMIKKSITFQMCKDELYPLWQSQNRPWEINLDHCSQCSYGSICPR
jgi:hypothetical protein